MIPIHPEELKSKERIMEVVSITVIPDGIPEIKTAINAGISERSAFKKGNVGKIDKLPIYASNNAATENIEL